MHSSVFAVKSTIAIAPSQHQLDRLSVQDDVYSRSAYEFSSEHKHECMTRTNGQRLAANGRRWPEFFFPPRVRPRFPGGTSHSSRAEARQTSETVRPNTGCKSLVRGEVGGVGVSARPSRGSQRWLAR